MHMSGKKEERRNLRERGTEYKKIDSKNIYQLKYNEEQ